MYFITPPKTDLDWLNWSTTFNDLISSDPPRYGVQAPDAAAIADQQQPYATAYAAVHLPLGSTTARVLLKNDTLRDMLAILRPYAKIICRLPGVTTADKAALGLRASVVPTPPPDVITTWPILTVAPDFLTGSFRIYQHTFRARDSDIPDTEPSPKKPIGYALELIYVVQADAPTSPSDCEFFGIAGKLPFVANVALPVNNYFWPAEPYPTAWYYGRWHRTPTDVGPFSPVVSVIMPHTFAL